MEGICILNMFFPYWVYIKNNLAKLFFLLSLSAVLCSLGLLCVNHVIAFNQRLDVYRYYGLDKGILYNMNYGMDKYNITDEEAENIRKTMLSMEEIEHVEYLSETSSVLLREEIKNSYIYTIPFKADTISFPWKIIKGNIPRNKNEICVSSNFIGRYNVGDDIVVTVNYFTALSPSGTDSGVYGKESRQSKACFTITGFFDENAYMPPSEECSFSYDLSSWNDSNTAYAFAIELTSDDGKKIEFLSNYNYLYILPKKHADIKNLANMLPKVIKGGTAYDFNHYVEFCYNDNRAVNDMCNIFLLSTIVLTMSVLISYTVIQLSIFKRDMIIYYLEGCTWKRAVGTSCFATLPIMILGMLCGVILYKYFPLFRIITNGSYIYTIQAVLIVIGVAVSVFTILCLLFYLFAIRQSPIEIIREE